MWFFQIVRSFFYTIDNALFNFIPFMYDVLIKISRTSILSQGEIQKFASRIQTFLGVFMLFKVSFSLVTYLINPDEFGDKAKGFGKLWQNVIISLILLVLTPYAFNMAYDFQSMVLEDNTLAKLIFSDDNNKGDNSYINSAGDTMAYVIMIPFFSPNYAASYEDSSGSIKDLNSCITLVDLGDNNQRVFNSECKKDLLSAVGAESDVDIENYVHGIENSNLGLTFRYNIAKRTLDKDKDTFLIDYNAPLTTVIAVIVGLLLVTFCMDVALRSLKLSFLQLIAPIPIISYIDPKSGKDGIFKKWYQMCFSTYISLFVRLLALYLGIYIISMLSGTVDVVNGSLISDPLVQIFIVIGALMFAKQLPKILEGLGIKLDGAGGKFTLIPFKKFEDEALGGKRILGAAGALTAGTVDRAARLATAPGLKNKLAALNPLSAVGNVARGFMGNGGFSGGMKTQANLNRRLRESRIKGLSPTAAYLDYFGAKFGLDDAGIETEATINEWNKRQAKNAEKEIATKKMENDIEIDKKNKENYLRKKTQASHENVGKQVGRLFGKIDDFIPKKGDFDTGANNQRNLSALNAQVAQARQQFIAQKKQDAVNAGLDPNKIGFRNRQGKYVNINNLKDDDIDFLATITSNGQTMSLGEYNFRERRKLNEKNYKSNRTDDKNNFDLMKKCRDNNTLLSTSMLIGDQYFEAGQEVTTDDLRRAENAMNSYIKTSQRGAINDFDMIVRMNEIVSKVQSGVNLTQDERDYYNDNRSFYNELRTNGFISNNGSDINAFNNIKDELTQSVVQTNNLISNYNNEYNEHLDDINYNPNIYYDPNNPNNNFYDNVNVIKGSMENGANVTQMNIKDREIQTRIDDLETENNNLYANKKVMFWDKKDGKYEVSLEYSNKHTKAKDEEISDYKNRHKELANIHESMGSK